MDGGVLAGRILDGQGNLIVREAAGRDNGGTRFLGTTLVVGVSNHSDDYMLDLVNVAARKRRYAQNV